MVDVSMDTMVHAFNQLMPWVQLMPQHAEPILLAQMLFMLLMLPVKLPVQNVQPMELLDVSH
jgi:hypothetical protein